ncbi:MAG: threonine--tRNA ligase, partial [Thermoprotei archaeon]
MKLLLIHADHLDYKVTGEAMKNPEPIPKGKGEASFNECLVVFCAVETVDETNPSASVETGINVVEDVAKRLGVSLVVLYPYAHLSSNLAKPTVALEILRCMEDELGRKGFKVHRAPFGWYKAFTLSCKGHPLSELSRSVEPVAPRDLKEVVEVKPSRFIILDPSGKEFTLDPSRLGELKILDEHPLLKQLIMNELGLK